MDLDRRSSGELVAAHIRRLVVEGEYRRGDHVRQDDLAAELGVSRIPVREAIVALEREGWVTVAPHRGAFVSGIDADYVRDHFQLHAGILGVVSGRVAERADDVDLARVAEAAAGVADCDPADAEAVNAATYRWVDSVEAAAHAPRLASMTRVMSSIVPGNFFATVDGASAVQREAVAAVTASLLARDADGARSAYASLMRRHGDLVIALLDERGVLEPDASSPVEA